MKLTLRSFEHTLNKKQPLHHTIRLGAPTNREFSKETRKMFKLISSVHPLGIILIFDMEIKTMFSGM